MKTTDQPISSDLVRETALADGYALVALLLQFPDASWFSRLSDESLGRDVEAIARELSLDRAVTSRARAELAELAASLTAGSSSLADARREYTRLFNHPDHPAIPLFEGVFLDEERVRAGKPKTGARLFVNPAALDAERCYRQAGFKRSSDANVSADCISTELEFAARLHSERACALRDGDGEAKAAASERLAEFERIHATKWFACFFARCAEESAHPLYRAVGRFGTALIAP